MVSVGVRGAWQSGFFDHGTFMEVMSTWAPTVVVGRARSDYPQSPLLFHLM